MEPKRTKDTVGESSRSGSTPVVSDAYSPLASAAYSRLPVSRKLFSLESLRRPSVNISSSSAYSGINHTPSYYVHYRREKLGDFASSSSRPEKDRELKLAADPARKLMGTAEQVSLEKKHVSVRRDDDIDYYLLKESSKLKSIAISDHLIVDPLKSSGSKSCDTFENKSEVSDRLGFQPKPVKKRIISEIMNGTSATQKRNPQPVKNPSSKSGGSSGKLKGHSNTPPKPKSNDMVVRLGPKTKSMNEVVNGGNLHPFTAADFPPKTWNLRPRQPPGKVPNVEGSMVTEKPGEGEKREKAKKTEFSISLSKEEIEADFLAMTGSKPPKKCQKRGKAVQKQLDYSFPGLWLHTITPNSYRVPEKEPKI